ncbi:MAG: L-histidine N(alpha)-methyltransferase [Burkholderiaceae bacterium]
MSESTDTDLVRGLCAAQATLSPKYFYDRLGSRLFTAICELPEYYPTRTEAAILSECLDELASRLPKACTLVDLGAGDCRKAASLLPVLRPARYLAVDISEDFVREAVDGLARELPGIEMQALARDFTGPWSLPERFRDRPLVFFYPGSSIGNFTPASAERFLAQLAAMRGGGHPPMLLIGIDLVKDKAVLEAAYDDALGVTASFNLNALLHVNRVLGSDFVIADWAHRALYHESEQRIEMHLVAKRDLVVRWPGGERSFVAGQTIHSENSYKFTADGFATLLERSGFGVCTQWTDAQRRFMVVLAQASDRAAG